MKTTLFIQVAALLLISLPVVKAATGSAVTGDVRVDTRSWTLTSQVTGSGTVQGGGTYLSQTTATLTAVPSPGNLFLGWTGDASGTANPLQIFMDSNKTVGATFVVDSGGSGEGAPVAVADSYSVSANSSLVVPAMGVLTNDSNGAGGALASWLVTGPQHGSLTLNSDGGFTYTPAPGYAGADLFSYRASNATAISNVATVNLSVVSGTSQLIVNGSFESNLSDWNYSGNMEIQSPSPAPPDGSKLLAFNDGNRPANGVISQSFTTLPGSTYQLAFEVGVIGYTTDPQALQVAVDGSGNLLSQTITMNGSGSGSTIWSSQAFSFMANSTTTTLTFRDVSAPPGNPTSNYIDLLLDHVRVSGSSSAFTLTVNSSPANGASVAISPPDRNGNSGGATQFTRSFVSGTIVNLSAPASYGGANFLKWTRNGADYSSSAAINVTIDADLGLTAVYQGNRPPVVATDIPDVNATEDSAFSYAFPAGSFADPDPGDSLTYAASGLPAWLSFNSATRTFSGTPRNENVGFADITVTATDNGSPTTASVSDTFRITVQNVNDPPTLANQIQNQTATEDVPFIFIVPENTFADLDADNFFSFTATGLPGWLTFNSTTRTFSGTPTNANVGFSLITVIATDNGSPTKASVSSNTFRITVQNVNDPPTVAIQIPNQAATEDQPFNYTFLPGTFADVDAGNSFSYSAPNLPWWLTFNPTTRTFSGTPTNADVGDVDITVTATDSGSPNLSVSDTFRIRVANVNDAPTVANPLPNQNATEDEAFSYTLPENTFADVDAGNVFTYSATGLPGWLTFSPVTRTFSGTPTNADVADTEITVTAADNGAPKLSVSDTFSIKVNNVNDAPTVANPLPNQNATEDEAFSYTLPENTFADVDAGNVFTYSAAGVPAWLAFNPETRTFSGTPGDADGGFTDITVTATDNGEPQTAAVSATLRITVTGVNDVPVFTKGADQSLPAGLNSPQTVVGWATGVSDGDGLVEQALTFLANCDNPALFTTAPAISSAGTLTYTPSGTEGTTTISVTLTDDDTAGGSALVSPVQTFTITFNDSTGPAGGSMTLAPGATVDAGSALTLTFADWTDSSEPLGYEVLLGNTVVSSAGEAAVREISAPSTAGIYTLKGRIIDALGNATEVSRNLTVLTGLESWRLARFGSAENSGDGADHFDFDGDGVVNLVEYAFGMDPKAGDGVLLPRPVLSGGFLSVSYPVPPGVSGIRYGAQWSSTLAPDDWHDIDDAGTPGQRVFSIETMNRDRMYMRHVIESE